MEGIRRRPETGRAERREQEDCEQSKQIDNISVQISGQRILAFVEASFEIVSWGYFCSSPVLRHPHEAFKSSSESSN